jgi:recombination protein RecT
LPIDPNLGQAWIVPYGDKAQFQMATRGYVQLAQRSSQYKRINTVVIYANQFKSWNSLTEELDADFTVEGEGATVGYAAYFKLINGFEKLVYWSKSKVLAHAKKFSKTYNKKEDRFASWNKYKKQWIPSPWESDFDAMALKTVLKTALKNWGVLSIEMQTALTADQAIVKEEVLKGGDISNNVEYVDNPESESSDEAHDAEFTEENKDEPENKEKDIYEGTPFGDESK